MNTILIYPKLDFSGAQLATPPYSILFIADYLLKKSINVKICDLRFDSINLLEEMISNLEPEYIGISVMTGPQIYHALRVSKFIKENFDKIKIVWGGIHSTILPTQTLQNKFIDFIVRGEGEKAYYELVSGKNKADVHGLSFKVNKRIVHTPEREVLTTSELNQLKIPWNLINPKNYIKNGNINMITSRGCPYKCAFCINSFSTMGWRGWTAEKCMKEIDIAMSYGVKRIIFFDDNFFANFKRIPALFSYFKEQNITWKAELRVDRLNYSLAKQAREHGCEQMFFGAESGSQKVLNILNKKITIKDIINSARITGDEGIFADYSWMIGIPGETKEDIRKTLTLIKNIKQINLNSEFSIKILFPYPKTMIYMKALNEGFTPPSNLISWSKIRRERASRYLKHKNYLEMISITSAMVGKKIFEQEFPIFKLIKLPASFRWKHEIFNVGIENLFYKMFRGIIEKVISKDNSFEYDPFAHKIIAIKV